tara:strand:+ start:6494 stop:8158 length:1665 start_codon:yes stop_codon:yes gene_type:complete
MKIKVLAIVFIGSILTVNAQDPLPKDSFVVVKAYKPTIAEGSRIGFNPTIQDTQKVIQKLDYRFISNQVPVNFNLDPISAAKIKGEPLTKLYNGYAKVGVGNNTMPLAELYYHNSRSKTYSLGTHIRYQQNNNIKDYDNSSMSNLRAAIFGKKFWRSNTLTGTAGYEREGFNYYGFEVNDFNRDMADTTDTKQVYHNIFAQLQMKSTKQDSFNLRHEFGLEYYRIADLDGLIAENNIVARGNVGKFHGNEYYQVDATLDFNNGANTLDTINNVLVGIRPQINSIGEKFRLNIGMGIYVDAINTAKFHFYPIVDFKYNALRDVIVPYAGFTGRMERNNMRSLTRTNQFLSSDIELLNTNYRYEAYAGIRGVISSRLSFNTSLRRLKMDDFAMFVKENSGLENKFVLVYDDIEQLQLTGELQYQYGEKWRLFLKGDYFGYNAGDEEEVWHMPIYKITLSGVYDLNDKIMVRLDLHQIGEQFAKTYDNISSGTLVADAITKETLKGVFDANLGVEYRYTKRLSAFINFNNIGSVNYQRWQDYPTQRFNVLGGLTYSF